MKLVVVLMMPLLILAACNSQFNKVLKSKDSEYKLRKADEYFAKKKYKNAGRVICRIIFCFQRHRKNLRTCIISMPIVPSIKKITLMLKTFSKDF